MAKQLKLIVIAWLYTFGCSLSADTFITEISDKNINLAYDTAKNSSQSFPSSIDGSLLYTEYNDHQDLLAGVGFHFMPKSNTDDRFTYEAAIKIFAADPLDYYLTTVAVGGLFFFEPELLSPVKLAATIYYSPDALTFNDGDRFLLLDVAMDYYFKPELAMHFGYRRIETGIKNVPEVIFDRGGYIGLKLLF